MPGDEVLATVVDDPTEADERVHLVLVAAHGGDAGAEGDDVGVGRAGQEIGLAAGEPVEQAVEQRPAARGAVDGGELGEGDELGRHAGLGARAVGWRFGHGPEASLGVVDPGDVGGGDVAGEQVAGGGAPRREGGGDGAGDHSGAVGARSRAAARHDVKDAEVGAMAREIRPEGP